MTGASGERLSAFVAMCFDTRLLHVYSKVVKPILEMHGFTCVRGDEILGVGSIVEQIKDAIQSCDLVVCDLTFENPNVFYELGIAHTLGKATLMISQTGADIPFDVTHMRVVPYEDTKIGLLDLREALVAHLSRYSKSDPSVPRHSKARLISVSTDDIRDQRAALFSPSSEIKRYAIKFLADYGDKDSFQTIARLATLEAPADVLRDAFTALHKIDPDQARQLLIQDGLRHQKEYLVRERVVGLLGTYEADKELVKQVIAQLGDSSWGVRAKACNVLGRWRLSEAIAPVQKMLADPVMQVQLAAAEALEVIAEGHIPGEPVAEHRAEGGEADGPSERKDVAWKKWN
jgi:hypothetical protein